MVWFIGLAAFLAVGFVVCLEIRRAKPAREDPQEDPHSALATLMQNDLIALQEGEDKLPVDPESAALDIETLAQMAQNAEEPPEPGSRSAELPETEEIVLVWDDTAGPKPALSLSPNTKNPALMDVVMDRDIVASVPARADLELGSIVMIPKSKAVSLGWAST
ncbi:MAG: hypothetical protein AAF754_10940 [Pseudomonadota bacterium]